MVYQKLCKNSKAPSWDDKKRYKVELKRKIAEDIWIAKKKVYNKANFGNTRLR